jgi:hypothetical protein
MRWKWLGSWRTAAETLVVVAVLVGLKLALHYLGWEFITVNTLFTSVIGGAIFLFSLILAGTLADFKEGERFPAEMVAACEGIFEDGQFVKATHPEFDLERLRSAILGVVDGFMVDAGDLEAREALTALSGLQASFLEMESLGVPPNYIIRLKSEEGNLRKGLLRMYHIQKTSFLPLAYTLVKSLVVLLLGMLLFTKIEPLYDSVIIVAFLTFLFVYILRLLQLLDQPFRAREHTKNDVSLFLLEEFRARLEVAGATAA